LNVKSSIIGNVVVEVPFVKVLAVTILRVLPALTTVLAPAAIVILTSVEIVSEL